MKELVILVYSHDQVRYLIALVAANLLLGVVTALLSRDFQLRRLGDWLTKRVIPVFAAYGAAAIVALAQPDWVAVRDAAFWSLVAVLISYIAGNLKDLGVPIPGVFTGKSKA